MDAPTNEVQYQLDLDAAFEMDHEEIVEIAMKFGRSAPSKIPSRQEMSDWPVIKEFLTALGYLLDSTATWTFLGLPNLAEGIPRDIENLIASRIGTLKNLLTDSRLRLFAQDSHREEAGLIILRFPILLKEARAHLKAAKATVRRSGKYSVPQWLEPSPDLALYLDNLAEAAWESDTKVKIMLTLSAINPMAQPCHFKHHVEIAEARAYYKDIADNQDFITTFSKHDGFTLVVWSPTTRQEFDFYKAGIKAARKIGLDISFIFIHHFNHIPAHVKYFNEFFNHQFLNRAWGAIITDASYLKAPTRIVTSSELAPLHTIKSIALFKAHTQLPLDTEGRPIARTENDIQWKQEIWALEERPTIVIDFHESLLSQIEFALDKCNIPSILAIAPVKNSKGYTAENKMLSFDIILRRETETDELQYIVNHFKTATPFRHASIGTLSLYNNDDAMHIDMVSAKAITVPAINDLVRQSLIISPNKPSFCHTNLLRNGRSK